MKTDTQVQEDVIAELKWEPSISATEIGVAVKDGIVTLSGRVGSYAEKHHAEHAAQRVYCVKALAIELEIVLPGSSQRSDADIARAAESSLEWTTYLPVDGIKVMVEGGCITLSGAVDWEYQRRNAAEAVRYLLGVTAVSNQIIIKTKASSDTIKTEIEAALRRRVHSDAMNISVHVHDAVVTLTGTAHCWPDRELANHTAWASAGVQKVIDKIAVSNN